MDLSKVSTAELQAEYIRRQTELRKRQDFESVIIPALAKLNAEY